MSEFLLESVETVSTDELEVSWHNAPRGWGHSLHTLSPYVGGFPPALARYFIDRYSREGDIVLDPFAGGGTTPLEAGLSNRQVFANDAFTYAYTLTTAKCNPLSSHQFEDYLGSVVDQMESLSDDKIELENEDIEVFYSKSTLDDILRMREVLAGDESQEAYFLKALMSGILHGPSESFLSVQTKDTYSGSVDYVKEYIEKNGLEVPDRDVEKNIRKKYQRVTEDGIPQFESEVTLGDARELPFDSESADFVLTSPPYMHMLDYTWNNWIRLWWLNVDRKQERDSLDITADVEKYRSFISESLQELYRVLKQDSRAVLVVGDAKKHRSSGTKVVRTGQLIAEAAIDVGFELDLVIDDTYDVDKRSYVRFNELKYDNAESDKEDSEDLIERCIVLNKGSPSIDNTVSVPWS
jgi:DNA modification methylase